MSADLGGRTTVFIHYYRAMVGRADTWRTRMDTTTNWAIGATAALISFCLGSPDIPHFVIFFSSFLTLIFLLLEARRLTFYHLWQQRVLMMERRFIGPSSTAGGVSEAEREELERDLAPHLGQTVPTMSIRKAISRRLRRVYVYLFVAQVLAWLVKLEMHPTDATSLAEWASRAALGPVPGPAVMGLVAATLLVGAGYAAVGGRPWGADKTPL